MKKLLFLLLLPILSFGQNYTERPLPAKKPYAQVFGFIEHVPSNAKLPLLIVLTGFGENPGNGRTDIYRVLNPGLGSLVRNNIVPVDSFIILLPQNTNRSHYYNAEDLHKFVEYAKKSYNCDTSRVYITGLSGGSISLYNYLRKYACTAAITLCGSGTSKDICSNGTTKTPLWIFHGTADGTVKPGKDVILAREYNKCYPAEPASLFLLPGMGHNIWDTVYKNKDIYYWLLKHKN